MENNKTALNKDKTLLITWMDKTLLITWMTLPVVTGMLALILSPLSMILSVIVASIGLGLFSALTVYILYLIIKNMKQKQTAVEWLEKNISLDMNPFELIECFNKAKEMEKEQSAIADVVMWLYEKHGIWINVDTLGDEKIYPKWNYKLIDLKNPNSNVEWESKQLTISYEELIKNSFNSPTEAYRAAINYTLENLIKKWAAINKQQ